MPKKYEPTAEPTVEILPARGAKKSFKAGAYYSILNEMRFFGADRETASSAAELARGLKPGECIDFGVAQIRRALE